MSELARRRPAATGSSGGAPSRLGLLWSSTLGKKIVVAVSGLILVAYLVVHMLGNLKAFQGTATAEPAPIDRYAEFLRTAGKPVLPEDFALWTVRVVLLAALVAHVAAIVSLARTNLAARPAGHRSPKRLQRGLGARTMQLSGVVALAFIVFHILQFTTGTVQAGAPIVKGEVYRNLSNVFGEWYYVLVYVVAVGFILLHLRHGLWSMTQTLGWDTPDRNALLRHSSTGVAVALFVGFVAVPVLIWVGALPEPSTTSAQAPGGR